MVTRQNTCVIPRKQTGVGLIEVLIAVLVMAVGLLGIAAMQATGLRNSQSALERSQAVVQTYAILDAMRANPGQARAKGYDKVCTAASGNGGGLAAADHALWKQAFLDTLGAGACGAITCSDIIGSPAKECEVIVEWNDSRGTGGVAKQQVLTKTRI